MSKEYIYNGSQILAEIASGAITYHHPDHLSDRADTDNSGNVVSNSGQTPFGENWYGGGNSKWKFTTYERESESGLDYAQFRTYNSGFGRFMSADLLGGQISAPQSLNRYSYSMNDPVNLFDPLGLVTICVTPYWGTEWSDGHIEILFGAPFCWNLSNFIGGGGGGGGTNNDHQKQIEDLRQQLLDRLRKDPDCLIFLGPKALGILSKIPIDEKDLGNTLEQAVTLTQRSLFQAQSTALKISINSGGYFFKPGYTFNEGAFKGIETGTPFFQAAIMYHEIGHGTGSLIPDGNDVKKSEQNTKNILEKCKKALSGFSKK